MKDEHLVPLSTPEAMVLNPANDYVAEFARNAPRDRVVSLRAIMKPAKKTKKATDGLNGKSLIGDVAEQVLNADQPLNVVDDDHMLIGTIDRKSMTSALFSKELA